MRQWFFRSHALRLSSVIGVAAVCLLAVLLFSASSPSGQQVSYEKEGFSLMKDADPDEPDGSPASEPSHTGALDGEALPENGTLDPDGATPSEDPSASATAPSGVTGNASVVAEDSAQPEKQPEEQPETQPEESDVPSAPEEQPNLTIPSGSNHRYELPFLPIGS